MVDGNHIKVYMPKMVEQELESQRQRSNEDILNKIEKEINTLKKSLMGASDIRDFETTFVKFKNQTVRNVKINTLQFFLGWNVEIIDLNNEQTEKAFDAYFTGLLPFKKVKNRVDTPDSFICRAIEFLKENRKIDLTIIANDNPVVDNFKDKDGRSIEDFVETEAIQTIFSIEEKENKNAFIQYKNDFIGFLDSQLNSEGQLIINELLDELVWNELDGQTISDNSIPDDNSKAVISNCYEITETHFDFSRIVHYGDNKISTNFESSLIVDADFYIFKSDYFARDYTFSVSDWNDHFFQVSDQFQIQVEGRMMIDITFFYSQEYDNNFIFSITYCLALISPLNLLIKLTSLNLLTFQSL